jgi:hypothetical protein
MIQGPSLPSAWTWTSTQSPTLGGGVLGVLGADTEVSEIFDTGGTPESSQSLDQLN